jgi:hypothetical protein
LAFFRKLRTPALGRDDCLAGVLHSAKEAVAMVADSAPSEIDALKKLVMLSRFAMNRTVRTEEIHRQLANAKAMVSESKGAAADRFAAHDAALRKFLNGATTREVLGEELAKTQDLLALGRP